MKLGSVIPVPPLPFKRVVEVRKYDAANRGVAFRWKTEIALEPYAFGEKEFRADLVLVADEESVVVPKRRCCTRNAALLLEVITKDEGVLSPIIPTALIFGGTPLRNGFG